MPQRKIEAQLLPRFQLLVSAFEDFDYRELEHARSPEIYTSPLLLVQQSLQNDRLVASECFSDVAYSRSYFGIPLAEPDRWRMDLLNAYLNSSLAMYCFFLTATRFGIDKQIAEQNDLNRLPFRTVETAAECEELRNITRKLAGDSSLDLTELDEAVFDFYCLPDWQREYVTDTIRFDLDFLRSGSDGISAHPAEQDDLRLYAETMVKYIRSNLAPGELSVNADVVNGLSDLRCVIIRFDEERNRGVRCTSAPEDNFSARLAELLHAPLASGVQLRRSLVHFDEDRCIIAKHAQKRFWSRARAYDDADSIFDELCRGGE